MADVSQIFYSDKYALNEIDKLLAKEGIRRDKNLDYTCGIYDEDFHLIATGSCFKNTLRCLAVSSEYQGEGLLNIIVTHLVDIQFARGNTKIFIYTKCGYAKIFGSLGFYEIARVDNEILFLENQRDGFKNYLEQLKKESPTTEVGDNIAAIVMNANPFTLGHQYLVERAAAENKFVHLFLVSEDLSVIPFSVRKKLVMEGTAHIKNVIHHDCGSYIISSATFPSYFQKDDDSASRSQAKLDINIFKRIAEVLGINRRYVGEEPLSVVTNIYNQVMREELAKAGIDCIVVPRIKSNGEVISASGVRELLRNGNFSELERFLPETTIKFFQDEGFPVELEDMLACRERRAENQRKLLEKYHTPIISFTLNIPGKIKTSKKLRALFDKGLNQIHLTLASLHVEILAENVVHANTGDECLMTIEGNPKIIKEKMTALEESCPVNRLFDIDVIDEHGNKLSRKVPRKCLICNQQAQICSRSRKHSITELTEKIKTLVG